MSLLLTDNALPGSSDGMMPGFTVEEGGMEKLVIVATSVILLIFYWWTTWRFVYMKDIEIFAVISVENALCLKMVQLITTSA